MEAYLLRSSWQKQRLGLCGARAGYVRSLPGRDAAMDSLRRLWQILFAHIVCMPACIPELTSACTCPAAPSRRMPCSLAPDLQLLQPLQHALGAHAFPDTSGAGGSGRDVALLAAATATVERQAVHAQILELADLGSQSSASTKCGWARSLTLRTSASTK